MTSQWFTTPAWRPAAVVLWPVWEDTGMGYLRTLVDCQHYLIQKPENLWGAVMAGAASNMSGALKKKQNPKNNRINQHQQVWSKRLIFLSFCWCFHWSDSMWDQQGSSTVLWETFSPFRSLSTMKVNPVVRGCSTYSNFGRLFWAANSSLLCLVFSEEVKNHHKCHSRSMFKFR